MYHYCIKYGLKNNDRTHTTFVVCTANEIETRAKDVVNTFYDNLVEQGIIFDNTLDYHVKKVQNELAQKNIEWCEDAIWIEAYMSYCIHRSLATWYQIEEIN